MFFYQHQTLNDLCARFQCEVRDSIRMLLPVLLLYTGKSIGNWNGFSMQTVMPVDSYLLLRFESLAFNGKLSNEISKFSRSTAYRLYAHFFLHS